MVCLYWRSRKVVVELRHWERYVDVGKVFSGGGFVDEGVKSSGDGD